MSNQINNVKDFIGGFMQENVSPSQIAAAYLSNETMVEATLNALDNDAAVQSFFKGRSGSVATVKEAITQAAKYAKANKGSTGPFAKWLIDANGGRVFSGPKLFDTLLNVSRKKTVSAFNPSKG